MFGVALALKMPGAPFLRRKPVICVEPQPTCPSRSHISFIAACLMVVLLIVVVCGGGFLFFVFFCRAFIHFWYVADTSGKGVDRVVDPRCSLLRLLAPEVWRRARHSHTQLHTWAKKINK